MCDPDLEKDAQRVPQNVIKGCRGRVIRSISLWTQLSSGYVSSSCLWKKVDIFFDEYSVKFPLTLLSVPRRTDYAFDPKVSLIWIYVLRPTYIKTKYSCIKEAIVIHTKLFYKGINVPSSMHICAARCKYAFEQEIHVCNWFIVMYSVVPLLFEKQDVMVTAVDSSRVGNMRREWILTHW